MILDQYRSILNSVFLYSTEGDSGRGDPGPVPVRSKLCPFSVLQKEIPDAVILDQYRSALNSVYLRSTEGDSGRGDPGPVPFRSKLCRFSVLQKEIPDAVILDQYRSVLNSVVSPFCRRRFRTRSSWTSTVTPATRWPTTTPRRLRSSNSAEDASTWPSAVRRVLQCLMTIVVAALFLSILHPGTVKHRNNECIYLNKNLVVGF